MTHNLITILKNNYRNKSDTVENQKNEYAPALIIKQTQLNCEIFGHKKELLRINNAVLISKILKERGNINHKESSNDDTSLYNTVTKRKYYLAKIKNNCNILKGVKTQLYSKRKAQKEKDITQLIQKINELNKTGNLTGIWEVIKNLRKKITHSMGQKNYIMIKI